MYGAVKLVKNADIDKYKYSGYGTGFDRNGTYFNRQWIGKNVTTFGVDMDSSVHADSKKKEIIILVEGPTQGLEKKYSINFTESRKKFYLSLHYNRPNSCLFVNGVEIHKCKGKDSESVEKCIMPRKHCSRLFSR